MFAGLTKIVSTVASVLGVSSIEDITKKLTDNNITPEQQIQLAQIQAQTFSEETKDAQSARDREVQLSGTKWGWISILVMNLGAIIIMASYVALNIYALTSHNVDPQNQNQIITSSINIIMLLVGYWWGKSKKDERPS